MSFREKIHWVALVAILGGFGWYFVTLHTVGHGHGPGEQGHDYYFALILLIIGIILATMTIASIFMAIRSPSEVKAKSDERDSQIHRKGTHAAYYLLVVGMWTVAFSAHLGHGLFFILNSMLAVLVVSESVRIGTQLYYYRRGV